MHVGSATLVTDHLDWDHVFTTGLTQAPTHILVQISLSAAHLNFSPGLIWALNRCLVAERGAQAKAKLLLKGSLWTSNSAMQLCHAQSSTGNGCKVVGENERCQDFSPRDEECHRQTLHQVVLRPGNLVSQPEEKLVPLLEVSPPRLQPPSDWQQAYNSLASVLPPHCHLLKPDHTNFAIDLAHGYAHSHPAVQDHILDANQGTGWILCPNVHPFMGLFLFDPF